MCEICLSVKCLSRCPNADEIKIANCDFCNEDIIEGCELWTDENDYKYCSEECAIKNNGIKEINYDLS